MMVQNIDYLCLNEHELVRNLRLNAFENFQKASNISAVFDNRLFVWKQEESCILTSQLGIYGDDPNENDHKSAFFQVLLPSDQPRFKVEGILINNLGDKIAVWGKYGVVVIVLPKKVPPHGQFEADGKKVVYCWSRSLEERYFRKNKYAAVQQLKWHPGSEFDSHLVVLTTDNSLRIYRIEEPSVILHRCHDIAPKVNRQNNEIAVDFDFRSFQLPKARYGRDLDATITWKSIVWPMYVLKNNGEVLLFETSLDGQFSVRNIPKFKGPLLIQPIDFEFTDSLNFCAIKCLKFEPNILVLATTTGCIYHFICLRHDYEEEHLSQDENLRIFETIELDFGIYLTSEEHDSSSTCAEKTVRLYLDDSNHSRYFAVHQTGVHLITINLINELNNFLDANDDDTELVQPTLNSQSFIEYLLCTSVHESTEFNSIIGFAQIAIPTGFFALLEDGTVISKPLLKSISLPLIDFDKSLKIDYESPLRQIMKEPFDAYIQKCLLSGSRSKTILKMNDKSNLSLEDKYEVLSRFTKSFREDHFPKLLDVKNEIERRVKILRVLANYQSAEIEEFNSQKRQAQQMVDKLTSFCEQIGETQSVLKKRIEKLLVLVSKKQPISVKTDERFKQLMIDAETKISEYSRKLKELQEQHEYQKIQIENWNEKEENNEHVLDATQYESVEKHLNEMKAKIEQNRNDVNWINDEL